MTREGSHAFRDRVIAAAEAVLDRQGSVGPLELLQQMQLLSTPHFEGWKKANPHYPSLDKWIQAGPQKIADTYRFFEEWAAQRGLRSIEVAYRFAGRRGNEELQVTATGDPERERFFRTRYAPADLPAKKAEQLEAKLQKAPELVVFQLASPSSQCSECQAELLQGDCLFMEKGEPLCLTCADLDQLDFLPSGDTALTRRARKYSPLNAVVVRFNRRRKRYERQGVLVLPEAIARAEADCADDAEERAVAREKAARRRLEDDRELIERMIAAIQERFPHCPVDEARQIAEHTALRGSGRVGRTAAGRSLDPQALHLAVAAAIRHNHTDYDARLMRGEDRQEAREAIRDTIQRVLDQWGGDA